MQSPLQATCGPVYLVGAGPGDPRLLTLRAAECLARAEVILCDCSVDPRALELAGPAAAVRWLSAAGQPGERWPLSEIVARLVEAAQAGKVAVHLKDGDPELFSHGFEEIAALQKAGVPVEVVPGVTAATAAAALAEIPMTHAALSSAVALVTARQQRGEHAAPLDFSRLGKFPGTLVVYMPASDPESWVHGLIDGGCCVNTPVALVADAARPQQQVVRCTLGEVPEAISTEGLGSRVVAVVGAVADLTPQVGWYAARPLFGSRILLTRPRGQGDEMAARLRELGADVTTQPAIQIGPPDDWQPVDDAIARIERYQWLVFSSVNGVDYLLERMSELGVDIRRMAGIKLAAIGSATAARLRQHQLVVAVTPAQYRAEALAEALTREAEGKRFLLVRASRGREVLADRLRAAEAEVDQIVVYASRDVEQPNSGIAETLEAGGFEWVTVTSSAIARALDAMFGKKLACSRLASISPITSQTLRELGHEPGAEATEFTMAGLIDAILQYRAARPENA